MNIPISLSSFICYTIIIFHHNVIPIVSFAPSSRIHYHQVESGFLKQNDKLRIPRLIQNGTQKQAESTQRWMAATDDDDTFNPNNSIFVEDTDSKGERTMVRAPEEEITDEPFPSANQQDDQNSLDEAASSSQTITADIEEKSNGAAQQKTPSSGANGGSYSVNGREFLLVDEAQQIEDEIYMKIAIDLATEEYVFMSPLRFAL